MNKFYCNWIDKGINVSHRGVSYCCANKDRKNLLPKEFWLSKDREKNLEKMNSNEKIKGCDGCYQREQKKVPSDRTYAKKYDVLVKQQYPKVMLIDFSNFCNLKCVMCGPTRSSQWAKEIDNTNQGLYTVDKDFIDNTVEVSSCLEQLMVQGGEPTIIEEYIYYFQQLKDKKYIQNINLTVTTNGTNVNKKFYDLLNEFKTVTIAVSIDAYGTANDYIRWPSKFFDITKKLTKILELENVVNVEIHNALNILSMFNFGEFLNWFLQTQKNFLENKKNLNLVSMKVVDPIYFSPFIAPKKLKKHFHDETKFFLQKNHNFSVNSNFKTQMQVLAKGILEHEEDPKAITLFNKHIKNLDYQRKCQIENYIPTFHDYF